MRLIDADVFKKILSEHEMKHDKRRSFDDYAWGASNAYEHASDLLDEMPTVERPHGEWIDESTDALKCSACGRWVYKPFIGGFPTERSQHYNPNYCAFCGADMRKEGEPQKDYLVRNEYAESHRAAEEYGKMKGEEK